MNSFSRASKRRLLWLVAKIAEPFLSKALFLTLTYPASEKEIVTPKRDIDAFGKRLARLWPQACMIWKIEYTKKGTPHFHALLLGVDFWDRRDLAHTWASVVKSAHPDHERAGTQVERVHNARHAGRYISKYIAKLGTYPSNHQGRVWGKIGSVLTYFSPVAIFPLTLETLKAARRMLDRLRLSFNRRNRFPRNSRLDHAKRVFASGSEVIRYLSWLNVYPLQLDSG